MLRARCRRGASRRSRGTSRPPTFEEPPIIIVIIISFSRIIIIISSSSSIVIVTITVTIIIIIIVIISSSSSSTSTSTSITVVTVIMQSFERPPAIGRARSAFEEPGVRDPYDKFTGLAETRLAQKILDYLTTAQHALQ